MYSNQSLIQQSKRLANPIGKGGVGRYIKARSYLPNDWSNPTSIANRNVVSLRGLSGLNGLGCQCKEEGLSGLTDLGWPTYLGIAVVGYFLWPKIRRMMR